MKLSIQNVVDWLERNHFTYSSDLYSNGSLFDSVRICMDNSCLQDVIYICDFSRMDAEDTLVYLVTMHGDVITVVDSDPETLLNSLVRMFDYFSLWEVRILQCILEKRRLEELGGIADEFFQGPAFLWCPDGFPRPLTRKYDSACCPLWKEILESPDPPHITLSRANGGISIYPEKQESGLITLSNSWGTILYSPLIRRGKVVCAILVIQYNNLFLPGDIHYLDAYLHAVEQFLIVRRISPETSFLQQYLQSVVSNTSMILVKQNALLEKSPWVYKNPLYVLAINPVVSYKWAIGEALHSLNSMNPSAVCFFQERDKTLVALVNASRMPDANMLYHLISDCLMLPVLMGASTTFTGLEQFSLSHRAAKQALLYCDENQSLVYSHDIIKRHLRRRFTENANLLAYVHPVLRILYAYDKRDDTHYLETLYSLVFHECNFTETAKDLHLSRNTLIQQVNRIVELTGLDLSDYQQFQAILFSFILYRDSKIF